MNIIVDTKEPKKLRDHIKRTYGTLVTFKSLPEGDYKSNRVICERKKISDLYGSILDKRLWAQVNRLSTYDKHHKILLVTGDIDEFIKKMRYRKVTVNKKMLINALVSIHYNYNFEIIWIQDDHAAIDFLFEVMRKRDAGHVPKHVKASNEVLFSTLLHMSLVQYRELFEMKGSVINILTKTTKKDLKKIKGIGDVKSQQIMDIIDSL